MIIYQYDDGKHEAYSTCIEQVKGSLPSSVDYMLLTGTSVAPNCSDYRSVSNLLRCKLASQYGDMVWLDSDTLIKKELNFKLKSGRPYFARGLFGFPENWAFIVNGCTDFFKEALKTSKDAKGIDWLSKYVRRNRDKINFIPKDYICHLKLSRAINQGKDFKSQENKDYKIYLDEDKKIRVKLKVNCFYT